MKAELEMEIFFLSNEFLFFKIFIFKLFFSMKNECLLTFIKSCLKMKHINLFVYQEYKMTQDLPFPIYFEI